MTLAGIYVRISDDGEGSRAGVKRQVEDCERICAERGWGVAGVYKDNDRSAYSGKRRPAYERLVADMKSGAIGAVVVWHADRLTRQPRELEDFIEVANAAGTELVTATGDLDLASAEGRLMARLTGAVAVKESEDKSRRLRRKHEELARDGKVAGGGHRPFGYEADRITINPAEAKLIRQAAERILAGESQRSILRDWAQQGVTTSAGNAWASQSLRRMLLSPRIAGLRAHRGEVVGTAEWEPIIDEATHHRLKARLSTKTSGRQARQRRYLLTGGLAVCGHCGASLVARPNNRAKPSMVCAAGPGQTGCGRLRVTAEPLEEFVGAMVIEALDSPNLVTALQTADTTDSDDAETMRHIGQWQDQVEQLAIDHYTDQQISRAEYLAASKALNARIEQAKTSLSRGTRNRVLADLPQTRQQLQQAWDQSDTSWRRALIAAVVDQIEVGPAVRGRNRFDPDRLTIHWRA